MSLASAAKDNDLFTCLGIHGCSQNYPIHHSLQVSYVALSIGVTLGYYDKTLLDLSVGCLLHDVGMLRVGGQAWREDRLLEPTEFAEIANHPCESLAMLGPHIDSLPISTRMIIYQTHERLDGSGYPRGSNSQEIHELAKVAAVADAFVGLVSQRPYRKPMLPHHALSKILDDSEYGYYDPAIVRALLRTVSLYPLGCYVSLNDGRVARVLRARGTRFSEPIVEAWQPGQYEDPGDVIDLSLEKTLKVNEPLARLPQ